MAETRQCMCGTERYCPIHRRYQQSTLVDRSGLRHIRQQEEAVTMGQLQRCGGGFRVLRKRVEGI